MKYFSFETLSGFFNNLKIAKNCKILFTCLEFSGLESGKSELRNRWPSWDRKPVIVRMSLPSLLLANINQGASIGPAPTLPTKDLSIGHFKDEQILCLAIYLEAFE